MFDNILKIAEQLRGEIDSYMLMREEHARQIDEQISSIICRIEKTLAEGELCE